MIPTEAPASAAARAARWPARPAPMTSTSCCGMRRAVYSRQPRGRSDVRTAGIEGVNPGVSSLMHRMGAQSPKDPRGGAIAQLAGEQHGVVSRGQLVALGFTRREIEGRVSRQWLHRVHLGVYAVGHTALTRNGRFMAAVFAC